MAGEMKEFAANAYDPWQPFSTRCPLRVRVSSHGAFISETAYSRAKSLCGCLRGFLYMETHDRAARTFFDRVFVCNSHGLPVESLRLWYSAKAV